MLSFSIVLSLLLHVLFSQSLSKANPCPSTFLVKPGGGEEIVLTPTGRNATLTCTVNGSSLIWDVNGLRFDGSETEMTLHQQGIFEKHYRNISSIQGSINSTLTVFGTELLNPKVRICCLTKARPSVIFLDMCCTGLHIYRQPLQPNAELQHYLPGSGSVNLTWTANLTVGVHHNFTIIIRNVTTPTSQMVVYETVQLPYYIFSKCGTFEVQVKAVNGAGESEPSNTVRVSLPLLPDISPVSNSLNHRVYKSCGEIMVEISFEPANVCAEQSVLKYCALLESQLSKISLCVEGNVTKILFQPMDGLEDNSFYSYAITAMNTIGKTMTINAKLSTTDILRVSVRAVVDYTIDLQCHFINGSDAKGCKIMVTSEHPSVGNTSTMLTKNNESDVIVSGQLHVNYSVDCYDHVFAFDIEMNGTISSSAIIERIVLENTMIRSQCPIKEDLGRKSPTSDAAFIAPVIIVFTLSAFFILFFIVLLCKKKKRIKHCVKLKSDSLLGAKAQVYVTTAHSTNCQVSQYTLQPQTAAPDYPAPTPEHLHESSSLPTKRLELPPTYDFPEKFSQKGANKTNHEMRTLSSDTETEGQSQKDCDENNERNIYFMLEDPNDVICISSDTSHLSLPKPDCYNNLSVNNAVSEEIHGAEEGDVIYYNHDCHNEKCKVYVESCCDPKSQS